MSPVQPIHTARLTLNPLREADAREMTAVLADPSLYDFIGGAPLDEAALKQRYRAMSAGSGNADEVWLNWIVRLENTAIGTAQATVTAADTDPLAYIAWIIGVPWQGRGYAKEAALAVAKWLRTQGIRRLAAAVHPEHRASAAVAAAVGLVATEEFADGERIWRD